MITDLYLGNTTGKTDKVLGKWSPSLNEPNNIK